MKSVLTVLVIISFNAISFAQTNRQPHPDPKAQEKAITQRQVVDLPLAKRNFRPKLTLQRALKLAETYLEKEKIDISSYYLYEAKFIGYGSKGDQEPCWFFWWVNEDGASGNYIEVIVSIETGNVRRLPSM